MCPSGTFFTKIDAWIRSWDHYKPISVKKTPIEITIFLGQKIHVIGFEEVLKRIFIAFQELYFLSSKREIAIIWSFMYVLQYLFYCLVNIFKYYFNLFNAKDVYTCDFFRKKMFIFMGFFHWYGFGMVPGLNLCIYFSQKCALCICGCEVVKWLQAIPLKWCGGNFETPLYDFPPLSRPLKYFFFLLAPLQLFCDPPHFYWNSFNCIM